MNNLELEQLLDQAEQHCKQRQTRLTPQRKAVLKLILGAEKPLSAYDILDKLPSNQRKPAPPTVYRALDFLIEQRLVHKLESLHAYIGCNHPEHPHAGQFLICTTCGSVDEIENPTLNASLKQTERVTGFKTQHHVVELLGKCSKCDKTEMKSG